MFISGGELNLEPGCLPSTSMAGGSSEASSGSSNTDELHSELNQTQRVSLDASAGTEAFAGSNSVSLLLHGAEEESITESSGEQLSAAVAAGSSRLDPSPIVAESSGNQSSVSGASGSGRPDESSSAEPSLVWQLEKMSFDGSSGQRVQEFSSSYSYSCVRTPSVYNLSPNP